MIERRAHRLRRLPVYAGSTPAHCLGSGLRSLLSVNGSVSRDFLGETGAI